MMLLDKQIFRAEVARLENLPAFPKILDRFNEMIKDPNASMQQIGEAIGRDQILSMKILKLVNSAFYGFPGRISTITHALVLLGYDAVKGLILSASVFDEVYERWQPLWKHSVGVSKASGILCSQLKIDDAEEIAMAGLLHDIGKVVLLMMEPDIYKKIMELSASRRLHLHLIEDELLGFDHSEVAWWLCERWNLPRRLTAPMSYHHKPDKTTGAEIATAVVFVANNLVKGLGAGTREDSLVESMPADVVERLQLNLDVLAAVIDVLEPELESLDSQP